jgi:hypothetical protein
MGTSWEKQDELVEYQSALIEDLTIQDALIFSAVYAAQAASEKCEIIRKLARKHPLFEDKPGDTIARVNSFTNWMQGGQTPAKIETLLRDFKPEQRRQAFEFATHVILMDSELTEDKKKVLRKLATKLTLEDEFVERKLANLESLSRE